MRPLTPSFDPVTAGKYSDWLHFFQRLIRCPSIYELEQEVTALVDERLRLTGLKPVSVAFDAERLRCLPGAQPPFSEKSDRRNLVVRLETGKPGRSLVFNAHLDVVPAGDHSDWTHPPFGGDVEGELIFGRGAYDDKAGVLLCCALAETLQAMSLPTRGAVIFQFVLEDEITGNGSLLCLEAGYGGNAAIIVDGTRGDTAINSHAGQLSFKMALKGRPASVSVSHMGINAAEMLARLLLEMREAIFELNLSNKEPWTMYPSPNQFVIHGIQAQGDPLTVPMSATASAYVTFTPPATTERIKSLLVETAVGFCRRYEIAHLPVFDWSGFEAESVVSASSELEAALRAAAQRGNLSDLRFTASTGTSDLRHFAARGIPCLLFGPGKGRNPHRPDECYDLSSFLPMLKTLVDVTEAWCSNATSASSDCSSTT